MLSGYQKTCTPFDETDLKLTDGIPLDKAVKSLSIRTTDELVAYRLAGQKAPSLQQFAGDRLEADEYHKALADKCTIIIDRVDRPEDEEQD